MHSLIQRILKHAKEMNKTFFESFKEKFICNGQRKKRKLFLKQKLMDRVDYHLDLRNIIESQITLMQFLNRSLTKHQRLMLEYQRSRLPDASKLNTSSSSVDSNLDVDESEKRSGKRVRHFLEDMHGFTAETELDVRLLLGLLVRDETLLKGAKKKNTRKLL